MGQVRGVHWCGARVCVVWRGNGVCGEVTGIGVGVQGGGGADAHLCGMEAELVGVPAEEVRQADERVLSRLVIVVSCLVKELLQGGWGRPALALSPCRHRPARTRRRPLPASAESERCT